MDIKIIEEILETILRKSDSGEVLVEDLIREYKLGEADLAKIEQEGYIRIQGGKISFTDTGQKVATRIIRCHRLAERLLDVLDISDKNQEEAACDFEHTVPPEVAEAICTLLGHPTQCPHGKEIPPGECCKRAEMEVKRIVVSLPELNAGERGKIVYISTKDHSRMDKLTSFGFFPGTLVKVHQTRPAFVLQIGQTTIAIDKDVLNDIHVRKVG